MFLYTTMTSSAAADRYTTTEDGGRQNRFAVEPEVQVLDQEYGPAAELANGRWAMIGFVAAIGAYVTTGQIIPGIF